MSNNEQPAQGAEKGIELFKQGKYLEALDLFKQSIAADSSDVRARNYLAATYSQMGDNMDAIGEFLELIRLDSTNPQYYFNLGMAYEKVPNVIKAEESYAKALELKPDYAKAKDRIDVIKKANVQSSPQRTYTPPPPPQQTPTVQQPQPPQMPPASQYQPAQPAGASVPPNTQYTPQYGPPPNSQYTPRPPQQPYQFTGGVPYEVKSKLNWGAFLLPVIWGIGNSVWIALIALIPIPIVWLGVSIYLLIKGNELAWNSKQYNSVEDFFKVQRIWLIVGLVVVAIVTLLYFTVFAAMIQAMRSGGMQYQNNFPQTPFPPMPRQ